jgi:hypothetical protein
MMSVGHWLTDPVSMTVFQATIHDLNHSALLQKNTKKTLTQKSDSDEGIAFFFGKET